MEQHPASRVVAWLRGDRDRPGRSRGGGIRKFPRGTGSASGSGSVAAARRCLRPVAGNRRPDESKGAMQQFPGWHRRTPTSAARSRVPHALSPFHVEHDSRCLNLLGGSTWNSIPSASIRLTVPCGTRFPAPGPTWRFHVEHDSGTSPLPHLFHVEHTDWKTDKDRPGARRSTAAIRGLQHSQKPICPEKISTCPFANTRISGHFRELPHLLHSLRRFCTSGTVASTPAGRYPSRIDEYIN